MHDDVLEPLTCGSKIKEIKGVNAMSTKIIINMITHSAQRIL